MSNWFKRNGIHLAIIGIFVAISFVYFTPVFKGQALYQGDVVQARAMQKEIMDVKEKTGKAPLWTNSMFGGMPSYQIWVKYQYNITTYVVDVMKTIFPNPVDTVLLYLLGAYLLFCVLKLNPWLAAAGAIAFAFSSYNFIIIGAGHSNKAYAIAFFAPIIASIILTLRGRYLLGTALTAFFLSMEIRSNHIQMTYYLLLAILIFIGIELYHAIKAKQTAGFLKSVGYLSAATLLAVAVNAAMLWTTYEYGQESIRGKSNLTQHSTTGAPQSTGVDRDYAYNWSQGVGECITFLVPNAYGGGSGTERLDKTSATAQVFLDKQLPEDQAVAYANQIGSIPGFSTYWGDKPGTGGPWYFGAIVCFLFVLGLLIVKNRIKWWLLAASLLSIFLSFGKNFPFISDLFFNYFPLYNKFRAVESTLVIAGLCFPILAFLAVQEVLTATDRTTITKKLLLSLYITGGLTLLMIVLPSALLSFRTQNSQEGINYLTQAFQGDNTLANNVANAIVKDRTNLERTDAIRTLVFIILAFGVLWAYTKQKINITIASVILFALTLVDMWGIDKRYLKDDNFIAKEDLEQPFKPREVDQFIMRDTDPDFRVFDTTLGGGTFSDATASYFHKTVGGYHAAKLKRFQELIENQFSKSVNQDVLDMLNTKYIITADPKTQSARMQANPTACGNAWFVKSLKVAKNADEEMQAISSFDPKNEAIVDKRYTNLIDAKATDFDDAATIKLVTYNPEHLVYEAGTRAKQTAVFSEIFYDKGWKMTIDGVEQPFFRVDYVLRAAQIPVGNHKIEFTFHPTSYYTGEGISLASSIILVLLLAGVAFTEYRKKDTVVAKKA
ncbi:YfhO family protein [Mucilaginibacter lacusdianchii]|uniref:YfhO family protein n=1 Tax=Mucilaginibacter lacusdianchii TaxID=2684211 RepID=UPI00131E6EF9|nr:YfhO family protein [Mucilaginibacter sp. JXJ CY 39]